MAMYNSNGMEKNPQDRLRRNKDDYVIDYVEWDGIVHGPELPGSQDWCDRTKAWWDTWRHSANSMVMTDTDWDFMLDTALLHNLLWKPAEAYDGEGRKPNGGMTLTQLAGEIRQRVGKFGVSYEDRKKLKMSVDTPMSLARMSLDADDDEGADVIQFATKLTKVASTRRKPPPTRK